MIHSLSAWTLKPPPIMSPNTHYPRLRSAEPMPNGTSDEEAGELTKGRARRRARRRAVNVAVEERVVGCFEGWECLHRLVCNEKAVKGPGHPPLMTFMPPAPKKDRDIRPAQRGTGMQSRPSDLRWRESRVGRSCRKRTWGWMPPSLKYCTLKSTPAGDLRHP